jgi:hypothetical protein
MRLLKLLIVAFLLQLSISTQAQLVWKQGYVLLNTGDTVKGEIKIPKKEFDFYSKVMVKRSEDEKKTFNPAKAKEFSFEGTRFVSKQVDGETTFVKCLSAGSLNLYEYQYEWQSGNNIIYKSEFYLEKANTTEMVKVKSGHFRKIVEEFMSGDTALLKDVQDKKYDFEQLTEVFQQYNDWAKTQKS